MYMYSTDFYHTSTKSSVDKFQKWPAILESLSFEMSNLTCCTETYVFFWKDKFQGLPKNKDCFYMKIGLSKIDCASTTMLASQNFSE